jgi:predicted RNA-binding protein with PUA-like domain
MVKEAPTLKGVESVFTSVARRNLRIKISTFQFYNMPHWLIKSEPFKYSWDQFVQDKHTFWDGVRNFRARNNLREMKKGDEVFFYHSNEGLEIVGIAKVAKEAYQDPTTEDPNWVVVDFKPVKKLKNPVSLATIKADKRLQGMELVKLGRLSVSAVTDEEWQIVLELSEGK